ncbi:hypothetical protein [Hoeflea sp.]|uniref:hypothetical protein n=1 Tax=Hoeflea sp. TaxID=1940281 RepID=UPI001995837E|nr:hypothetical protein [Hoeflea sp.]MBC7284255.1 hypothetical protein [Hoeflea sp.]
MTFLSQMLRLLGAIMAGEAEHVRPIMRDHMTEAVKYILGRSVRKHTRPKA